MDIHSLTLNWEAKSQRPELVAGNGACGPLANEAVIIVTAPLRLLLNVLRHGDWQGSGNVHQKARIPFLGGVILALAGQPIGVHSAAAMQRNADGAITNDAATVEACLDYVAAQDDPASAAEIETSDNSDGAPTTVTEPANEQKPEAYLRSKAKSKARLYAHDCIGVVADACLALDGNQSTVGMLECFSREAEVWDQLLNRAYKKSLAPDSYETDVAHFKLESDQIRKVQRAWIVWRDATCEALYQDGIPIYGSEGKVNSAYCEMLLTARQALWLDGTEPINFDQ